MLCYAMFYVSFVLQQQNGGDVLWVFVLHSKMEAMLSFSPIGAEMAEMHVLCLCSTVFVGGGGDRCKRSYDAAIMAETPWSRPLSPVPTVPLPLPHPDWPPPRLPLPHPDYPCKTLRECVNGVWMKYWALEIINDKWSNCGSDDSSCIYWRKNSYHFILIISGSHAPYYILGRRQICFIWFIHHYVIMNLII